jgi:DHA3 family macrolide efflux protein-like MFS transporter
MNTNTWRRDIAVFVSGQTVSMFGTFLVSYAISWHLTLTLHSGVVQTLAILFGVVPQGIVAIFAGVVADRMNRRTLIIVADSVIVVATVILAFIWATGFEQLWFIYLVLFIRSCGAGVRQPAVSALVPQLIPEDARMRINGIFQTAMSALQLVAPVAAGAILGAMNVVTVLWIDVGTALLGIALVLTIKVETLPRVGEPKHFLHELADGFKYTLGNREVRWVLTFFAAVMVMAAAPAFLTPLMVARTFGSDVWLLTWNEMAFGVGMMIGGIVVSSFSGKIVRQGVLMVVAAVLLGVCSVGLGLSPSLGVFYAFMALIGVLLPAMFTPSTTLLQNHTEPAFMGRVFGLVALTQTLAMPLGMVIFGPLADTVKIETLLVISGVMSSLFVVAVALLPTGREVWKERTVRAAAPAVEEAPAG